MAYEREDSIPEALLEQIAADGLDTLPELIRTVINLAMRAERQQPLGVEPDERSAERQGHANGSTPKTVKTRVGEITFDVPPVRAGGFSPSALEKGLRSERALTLALAEMEVPGVSTRKVAAITEQLCGVALSSMPVSRAAQPLDTALEAWRRRPLGAIVSLYLDARYEQVRVDGAVRDEAVLLATGVDRAGKRQVLGVAVSLSEAEVHWRPFLQRLVDRGRRGVELIVSDAHEGLTAARRAVFGGVPWQGCQFHRHHNAQADGPRQELKAEVAADIRAIFNARDRAEADRLLARTVQQDAKSAPKLATWLEANIPEGLTVFAFPEAHRRLLRTTNGVERLNREIRRRSRVVGIFPNESACLRLITAILIEISEEWFTGRAYLTFPAT
ncbi:MAG TPA: IS256 family transposase [Chloroflexi bacterium]|nr:IS256 family transposase [Chloroflexota bacterium]